MEPRPRVHRAALLSARPRGLDQPAWLSGLTRSNSTPTSAGSPRQRIAPKAGTAPDGRPRRISSVARSGDSSRSRSCAPPTESFVVQPSSRRSAGPATDETGTSTPTRSRFRRSAGSGRRPARARAPDRVGDDALDRRDAWTTPVAFAPELDLRASRKGRRSSDGSSATVSAGRTGGDAAVEPAVRGKDTDALAVAGQNVRAMTSLGACRALVQVIGGRPDPQDPLNRGDRRGSQ